MGVVTRENEVSSAIPPAKMMQICLIDAHIHMPKILPHAIKSIELLEGDGGPGTIFKTTFAEGSEKKYLKNKVEVVDKEKLVYQYSSIGGDPWLEGLEKISYECKFVASPDGGSVCKAIIKYYPKGDAKLDIDKLKEAGNRTIDMFKVVEAHVLANPDAY